MAFWNDPNHFWNDSTPWNAATLAVQSLQAAGSTSVTGTALLSVTRGLQASGLVTVTTQAALGSAAPSNLPNAQTIGLFFPSTPVMSFRLSSLTTSGQLQATGSTYITGVAALGAKRSLAATGSNFISAALQLGAFRSLQASGMGHAAGTANAGSFVQSIGLHAAGSLRPTGTANLGRKRGLLAQVVLHPITGSMTFVGQGNTAGTFTTGGVNSLTFNPS